MAQTNQPNPPLSDVKPENDVAPKLAINKPTGKLKKNEQITLSGAKRIDV